MPADYFGWLLRECKLSAGLGAAVRAERERRGLAPPDPPPRPDAPAVVPLPPVRVRLTAGCRKLVSITRTDPGRHGGRVPKSCENGPCSP